MVGHVAVAWDVAATKAAVGDKVEGVYDERSIYRRRGR